MGVSKKLGALIRSPYAQNHGTLGFIFGPLIVGTPFCTYSFLCTCTYTYTYTHTHTHTYTCTYTYTHKYIYIYIYIYIHIHIYVCSFNYKGHVFCRLPTNYVEGLVLANYKNDGFGSQWYMKTRTPDLNFQFWPESRPQNSGEKPI